MPRARGVVAAHERRKKILTLAKGNFSGRSRLYKTAKETVMRGLQFAYEHRRRKKRDFRRLWITRINAAARLNGLSYSMFMNGLKRAQILVDRKMLAEMAVNDEAGFKTLADLARNAAPTVVKTVSNAPAGPAA
jgi:large subunit ribosomal protein L20